jgi:sulfate adenylyltransferase
MRRWKNSVGRVITALAGSQKECGWIKVSSAPAPAAARLLQASRAAQAVKRRNDGLIEPHGGSLAAGAASEHERDKALQQCTKSIECSDRNACDVELLSNGGFSPLSGFMGREEYSSVVHNMQLPDGTLFALPVVLDTYRNDLHPGDRVRLDYGGEAIATVDVSDIWTPDKLSEVHNCYGYTTLAHPAVSMVALERGPFYIGGQVTGLSLPQRIFPCKTPHQLRAELPANTDVVAFQCRNPVHRAHYEIFKRSLQADNVGKDPICLVHPTCGPTQDEDIPGIVRYHTYEALQQELDDPQVKWAYLPYSMHMAGPREAVQHMIIRKNYGCTHFIIGRDMAGCKSRIDGEDFYGAFDAQEMAKQYAPQLGMEVVPSPNVVYTAERGYTTDDVVKGEGLTVKKISGTKFRQMLRENQEIPEWFSFDSVIKILKKHYAKH